MKQRSGGSILILAAWVLFFLASLTVAAAAHVRAVLQAAERLQERVLCRMQAASAAAWAVSVIEEEMGATGDEAATNLWDGVMDDAWNRDAELFTIEALMEAPGPDIGYVYFEDPGTQERRAGVLGEDGKLFLAPGNLPKITALLRVLGLDGSTGADALLDLLGVAEGSREGGLTPAGDTGYDPLTCVEDILMLEGVDNRFYRTLFPHVTVYGRPDRLNINAVSKEVLTACLLYTDALDAEVAGQLAQRVLDERQNGGFREQRDFVERCEALFADAPVVASALWSQFGLSTYSTAFRGVAAAGATPESAAVVEIVFVWDTVAGAYALWRER